MFPISVFSLFALVKEIGVKPKRSLPHVIWDILKPRPNRVNSVLLNTVPICLGSLVAWQGGVRHTMLACLLACLLSRRDRLKRSHLRYDLAERVRLPVEGLPERARRGGRGRHRSFVCNRSRTAEAPGHIKLHGGRLSRAVCVLHSLDRRDQSKRQQSWTQTSFDWT